MKVWVQEWIVRGKGSITSISRTKQQLRRTLVTIRKENKAKDESAHIIVDGNPYRVVIRDNTPYADMVQDETVFLNHDEMDIIYDAPSS